MMTTDRTQRAVEPFSYFPTHASAISGLGGLHTSPDPNYCFHTHYQEYLPGIVLLRVRLAAARATHGELAVRAHAYRPDSGMDVSLVAGSRTPLEDLDGSDLEIVVRVAAVPDVQYALFGYFSEPSDLRASGLSIVAEELGGESPEDFISSDTARSFFEATSVDMPNRLMADGEPNFIRPVSQALTTGQIGSAEYAASWLEIPEVDGIPAWRWRQAFALQSLETYGVLRNGANGLLIRNGQLPVASIIAAHGCSLAEIEIADATYSEADGGVGNPGFSHLGPEDIATLRGQFDFVVALSSSHWFVDKPAFVNFVASVVRQVLRGGIAVILFDHVAIADHPDDVGTSRDGFVPQRGDIEQLAVRIISHGSDVAQLSFAEGVGTNRAIMPICPFGLIVRR